MRCLKCRSWQPSWPAQMLQCADRKKRFAARKSDIERAQSAHSATHSAYSRLKQAADSRAGLVAQQELDESQAKDLGGRSASGQHAGGAVRRAAAAPGGGGKSETVHGAFGLFAHRRALRRSGDGALRRYRSARCRGHLLKHASHRRWFASRKSPSSALSCRFQNRSRGKFIWATR